MGIGEPRGARQGDREGGTTSSIRPTDMGGFLDGASVPLPLAASAGAMFSPSSPAPFSSACREDGRDRLCRAPRGIIQRQGRPDCADGSCHGPSWLWLLQVDATRDGTVPTTNPIRSATSRVARHVVNPHVARWGQVHSPLRRGDRRPASFVLPPLLASRHVPPSHLLLHNFLFFSPRQNIRT